MAGWTGDDVEGLRGRLVEIAGALPGVVVADSHGHVGILYRNKRIAWMFIDHHGDGRLALAVKAPPGELETLMQADPQRYFRPAYVTHWVGVELFTVDVDWDEVADLLEQAWRMRASKRDQAQWAGHSA